MGLLVVGTGALACLFAARLAGSGNEVTMLGSWQEGLTALRQRGVRLREMNGSTHQYPVKVTEGTDAHGKFSQALVLVKSWQTERVAKQLERLLTTTGIALTLQNGFGNYETLKGALGQERVALGVTTVGARMLEPGYVHHTGEGKVMIGFHPKLGGLGELLNKARFHIEMISDPESLLWGKLVINAAINPLTALLRVPNGELLSRPDARELMLEAAREAALVANKQGISLPYSDPDAAVEEVARNTAANNSSMLQDVLRGTPTEIDAINGAIIRAGEALGVPTPVNRMLWRLVKGLDYH
jgi:2-dehydropantoate 2-reductase